MRRNSFVGRRITRAAIAFGPASRLRRLAEELHPQGFKGAVNQKRGPHEGL
jgi:hypothetical protein